MNVYLICAEFEGRKLYKVGYTRRKISNRIKEFKTGNVSDIYLIDSFKSKWGTKIESVLHTTYKSKNINGEWFDLDDNDLKKFKELCQMTHNNLELLTNNSTYYYFTGKLY